MKHESHHLPAEHEAPDQWHRRTTEEGAPQAEHAAIASPTTLAIAFIAISTTVALTVLILVVFFDQYNVRYKAEQMENIDMSNNFNDYKHKWEEQDSRGYALADAETGAVRVPLDLAKQRVIDRYAKGPSKPSAQAPTETK